MPATVPHSLDSIDALTAAAAGHGLELRGGFAVEDGDGVPAVGGAPARHLLLFGNAGSAMWAAFRASAEYRDRAPDPLNRWSRRIGEALARRCDARALFPFGGAPHLPFLRWGKKAEALQNSQLGMLMHPRFGLWHAYRFALAFGGPADDGRFAPAANTVAAAPAGGENICDQCATKPCLRACPVNAFTAAGYDVRACVAHLESAPAGRCMTHGCQARLACPQGADYRYQPAHAAFHMRAFVAAMTAGEFADAIDNSRAAETAGNAPA